MKGSFQSYAAQEEVKQEAKMRKNANRNIGIKLLIRKYKGIFRIPENLNHYSNEDLKVAEKQFIKYALAEHNISDSE